MILSIEDRVVIMNDVLPEQGNILEMILVKSINKKVEFTPKEITDFNLKQNGRNLTWNGTVNTDVEVCFEESEINLLKEQYKKFDEEKRISVRMFDLYLKIKEL